MFPTNRFRPIVIVACLAAMLSGCGGGGSTTMDTSPQTMGTSPQTMDTGPQTLEVPATMVSSSLAPRYAETSADTRESMSGMAFGPLSAPIKRHFGQDNRGVSLPEDHRAHIESISTDATGGVTVEFVIDGQTEMVEFTATEFEDFAQLVIADRTYQIGSYGLGSDSPVDKVFFDIGRWSTWADDDEDTLEGFFAYGVRTKAENLPMGSASYAGNLVGGLWNDDENPKYATHRRAIFGVLTLEADFDDSTIAGEANNLWVRSTRQDGEQWAELPNTNSMEISEARIIEGRFAAGWTGVDSDPNNPADTSTRGFEGNMVGEFYGPNAEEVGGVINGNRDATATTPEQFIIGVFGGEKQQ